MGDMAEYAREHEFWFQSELENEMDYLLECGVWRTRNGRDIPISEMSVSHLSNAMSFLNNGNAYYRAAEWFLKLQGELKARLN